MSIDLQSLPKLRDSIRNTYIEHGIIWESSFRSCMILRISIKRKLPFPPRLCLQDIQEVSCPPLCEKNAVRIFSRRIF